MKKLFQIALIFITSVIFFNCNKSSTSTNNITSTSSQWTFKGITFRGLTTSNDSANIGLVRDVLKSENGGLDSISITFWSHPAVSATFTVNRGNLPQPDPVACTILVNHAGNMYVSTGKAGDKVDLKISGDTLTTTFTNVTVKINDTSFVTQTVSGTLIKKR